MRRLVLSFLICYLSFSLAEAQKPWTFWYWMYGAVSEAGIRADLQAMKDVGLGGCYLMPIRGTEEAPSNLPPLEQAPAQQLSPRFWQLIDYAMQQADSLGLQMGFHICDGFALAGGPWIRPEESMQQVVWSDTIISLPNSSLGPNWSDIITPTRIDNLPASLLPSPAVGPNAYYEDIATYVCPVWDDVIAPTPTVSGTIKPDEKGTFRAKESGYIQFTYDRPVTVRSVELFPSANNIQTQRLLIQASTDDSGTAFTDVRQLTPPRQGWQNTNTSSPLRHNSNHYTYSLPEVTARHFRFVWTPEGSEPGAEDLDAAKWNPVLKMNDIRLSAQPVIDQYESLNGSFWRQPVNLLGVDSLELSDIPHSTRQKSSTLNKYVRILRMGHASTGHTNATAGGAKGLECDKFSTDAVSKQIDSWFGAFIQRPHSHVVTFMHVDSWECGSQNWSRNFADEFRKRRGYDLLPFLPVYAGVPIDAMSEAQALDLTSEQVLRDVRLTINDLLQDVFFPTVAEKARQYGVQLSAESVAPTMVSDGMQHFKMVDAPMGEFWLNSPTHDKPSDMLDAISGAHIYGKNIVQAEGFTEVRGVWDETPASIKTLLDRNFALGMNRLFFHVFAHNPWLNKKPGMTLDGIGLFFQRDQTWFPEAKGLVDYVTRCQKFLQRGKPVVDIAVYTGEEMPRRALTPDRIVSILPGLFGPERVASEQKRLANIGQPMEESPVGVNHSAGILDLKDWVNPLHGYQYDSMNKDALLNMPFNYRVLVIPEGCLVSDQVRTRIDELRQLGVVIIDKPYTLDSIIGVPRDVKMSNYGEGIAYTHRRDGNTDIYFIANQTYKEEPVLMSFSVSGKQVAFYDPITDQYSRPNYWERNGHTIIECGFPSASSSGFIIFSDSVLTSQEDRPLVNVRTKPLLWDILFRESGLTLKSQQLFDWSQHANDKIRYFSGHARYTTTLKLNKDEVPQGRAWLSFPNVKDIAHVWINGKDCGIVWTAPYEVEITGALKKGKNKIEIEVVNTWHNAIRGADQGKAPFDGIWTNAKYRTKGDDLLPAGLLVEPEIKIEK